MTISANSPMYPIPASDKDMHLLSHIIHKPLSFRHAGAAKPAIKTTADTNIPLHPNLKIRCRRSHRWTMMMPWYSLLLSLETTDVPKSSCHCFRISISSQLRDKGASDLPWVVSLVSGVLLIVLYLFTWIISIQGVPGELTQIFKNACSLIKQLCSPVVVYFSWPSFNLINVFVPKDTFLFGSVRKCMVTTGHRVIYICYIYIL